MVIKVFNKDFPANIWSKNDAILQSNHTGTDMNSFCGVLMPNYQEQNTHLILHKFLHSLHYIN